MADEPTEPCPTCDRGLWHVGHKCYTYADLDRSRHEHHPGDVVPCGTKVELR